MAHHEADDQRLHDREHAGVQELFEVGEVLCELCHPGELGELGQPQQAQEAVGACGTARTAAVVATVVFDDVAVPVNRKARRVGEVG